MGHLRVLDNEDPAFDEDNPVSPRETSYYGCPAAWYRCSFVESLVHYERLLTESGFSENLHLSRCDDRLVLDAIAYIERERLACRQYYERIRMKELEK